VIDAERDEMESQPQPAVPPMTTTTTSVEGCCTSSAAAAPQQDDEHQSPVLQLDSDSPQSISADNDDNDWTLLDDDSNISAASYPTSSSMDGVLPVETGIESVETGLEGVPEVETGLGDGLLAASGGAAHDDSARLTVEDIYFEAMTLDAEIRVYRRRLDAAGRRELSRIIDFCRDALHRKLLLKSMEQAQTGRRTVSSENLTSCCTASDLAAASDSKPLELIAETSV